MHRQVIAATEEPAWQQPSRNYDRSHNDERITLVQCVSGVAIQVVSGAYAPPSAKYIIFWCVISQNVCMYDDLRVKHTGMFVKWFKHCLLYTSDAADE